MTAASRSQPSGQSIGSVLAQLRAEFPDVTISKIRFLESEGLVRPERTAAGYRQFAPADVERLRYVLAAQRDHYLPLKVIKEQLDALDRGAGPTRDAAPADRPRAPRPLVGVDVPGGEEDDVPREQVRLTREDVLAQAGVASAVLAELEDHGLVRTGAAGFYDPDAVLVARTAAALTGFGLEPRHLRAFRASADREVGLLAQIVTPMSRQRDPDARARADEAVRELAMLSVRLHALLVKTGLHATLGR